MKNLLKYFFYIALFIFTVIIFLPKENIYYYAVEKLAKKQVEIQTDKINDIGYALECEGPVIYYQNIQVANLDMIEFKTFGVYSKAALTKTRFDKSFERFFPKEIRKTTLTHTLFDPLSIKIEALLPKVNIEGSFDLLENKVDLVIKGPKGFLSRYNEARKYLKYNKDKATKTEDVYTYEYKL